MTKKDFIKLATYIMENGVNVNEYHYIVDNKSYWIYFDENNDINTISWFELYYQVVLYRNNCLD